jgi:hypothetical protein
MAYDSDELVLVSPAPLTGSGQTWKHRSTDAGAQVQVTGYITDGGARGMKVGDILLHTDTDTGLTTSHYVETVSSTYPGAVDLSDATTVVSGTNSD